MKNVKYKICSICNLKQKILYFYSKGSQCKSCLKDKSKKNYHKNKVQISKKNKQYRQNNKCKIKDKRKKYYENNKKDILLQQKIYNSLHKKEICEQKKFYRKKNKIIIAKNHKNYYKDNLDKTKIIQKEYRKNNLLKLNKYSRVYQRNKSLNNPSFKLRKNFSRAIYYGIKKQLSSKDRNSILNHLQYSIEELKMHLELLFSHPDNLSYTGKVWMSWENWGSYKCKVWDNNDISTWKWQIDHIIPQSNLPYSSMEDDNFKKCWALSNLRPLRADLNIIDGATRIRHKV